MDLEVLQGTPAVDSDISEIKNEFHPSNVVNVNILFPVGAILSMSGNLAPDGFLPCDGRVVNIADYPNLANYYENAQGSKNFYGGDGTTTFGIPDLRGEFLRGTGTNSHANQGSGGAVGEHQDGTSFPQMLINTSGAFNTSGQGGSGISKYDSSVSTGYAKQTYQRASQASSIDDYVTSRPTNTSVLYCVKY